jgi:hypothetical protein
MTNEVDEFFSHFGVKGMRWGVRSNGESGSRLSPGQKKALVIGTGVAVVAGATVVGVVLAKNGKLPYPKIRQSESVSQGKKVVDAMDHELWKKSVNDFSAEIRNAHLEETKYMIRDSARAGLSYSPNLNAYAPNMKVLPDGSAIPTMMPVRR